jgi:hypothetical protein
MRRIDGPAVAAQMLENLLDHYRILDAGDDSQPAAAAPAGLKSMANTRLRRCAQVRARCRPAVDASLHSLAAADCKPGSRVS